MMIRQMGASVALTLLCATSAPAEDPVMEVCGDVNESGSVSSADALLVLKEAVGQPVSLVCPAIDALATCSADLALCTGDSCGDDVVNAVGEQCDGSDLNGADCTSLAYQLGTLSCDKDCKFDATECSTCTGVVYKNTCWFLSTDGESCSDACANAGQVYDDKTRTVAGSEGTDQSCESLLDALGAPGTGLEYPSFACTYATGCEEEGGLRGRCASPTTTSVATASGAARVCACTSECAGVNYRGACWFFGDPGDSCAKVCAGNGKTYDEATRTVAGSDGTDEACRILLDKLEAPGTGLEYPSFPCSVATGCVVENTLRGRCATPSTTSDASSVDGARVCACQ